MSFIYTSGKWEKAEKMKINSEDKYYVTTVLCKGIDYRRLADETFRYFNDRWEFYSDSKWKSLDNPNFEVIAYMERINVEAYEGE